MRMSLRSLASSGFLRRAALVALLAGARDAFAASRDIDLRLATHHHEVFERPIARVATSSDAIVAFELLNDRELLLRGAGAGVATVTIWFVEGGTETLELRVVRDVSLLARALADLAPGITVETAPDRDAIVLRGRVPDLATARAAIEIARRYVGADRGRDAADALVALPSEAEGSAEVRVEESEGRTRRGGEVIDLLTIENLPPASEQRIAQAIAAIGASGIRVERLLKGDLRDDAADVLLLDGEARDQTELARVLHVAAAIFLGEEIDDDDVKVLADESGALFGQQDAQGGNLGSGLGQGSSALFGSSSGGSQNLRNRVGANFGRAKVVAVKGGRILSLVRVRDLPQVRVDARLFEVRRDDLLTYAPEFELIGADEESFGENVSAVTQFLAEGFSQSATVTFSRFSVDAAFSLLESRGLGRSLARPSLTVLSGERALFQVGGQVPIPQNFISDTGAVVSPGDSGLVASGVFSSVEFKDFGVQLSVRPLIGEDGVIVLDVVAQTARPDEALTTVIREATGSDQSSVAFETRAVRTTARLADGQTLLVGGLVDRRTNDSASYTPWLEHVPLLGWAFKRLSLEDRDVELVISLHPVIQREPRPELPLWRFPDSRELLARTQRFSPNGENRELESPWRHSGGEADESSPASPASPSSSTSSSDASARP
jgi:pilus assembly protein CpaC